MACRQRWLRFLDLNLLDQRYYFALGIRVAGDIPPRRGETRMTGQLLDISQATACLDDLPCCSSDEGATAAVRTRARDAELAV
jgi:hypothetical protein